MIFVAAIFIAFLFNGTITGSAGKHIVPLKKASPKQTAIVLGAEVYSDGTPSAMLYDRIKTGVRLYKAGKVDKILMTGDHGGKNYDETNAMRRCAQRMGVPKKDIFTDYAGFSTYESMYRAKKIFNVKSAIVVTQKFHLPRSVYIARKMGIDAQGVPADIAAYPDYTMRRLRLREFAGRCKDFVFINVLKPKPTFLGKEFNITGDGRKSHDNH